MLNLITQNLTAQSLGIQEPARINSQQQIVKNQGTATHTLSFNNQEERSEFITHEELNTIKLEITDIILKNYYDEALAKVLVMNFQNWINKYNQSYSIKSSEFVTSLTTWLRSETEDKHFIFQEVGRKSSGAVKLKGWYGEEYNYGLSELRWYPEETAYLNYRGFNSSQMSEAKQVIDIAMKFFALANTIIIDLRENPGGGVSMAAYMASYFLPADSISLWEKESRINEVKKTEYIKSYINLPSDRIMGKKVFILSSKRTGSAAELFIQLIKSKRLAYVIGENTSGATHSMALFPVAKRFTFGLPNGRMLDIETKQDTQFRGGLSPDFYCSENEALEKALIIINNK